MGEDTGCGLSAGEAILMHDPISPGPSWGLPMIKDQNLLHPHHLVAARSYDRLVLPRCLPVTAPGRPVRSITIPILGLSKVEKIPLLLAPTRKVPRIVFAEIDLGDDGSRQWTGEDLPLEVLDDKLFISRVESESGGQPQHPLPQKTWLVHDQRHPLTPLGHFEARSSIRYFESKSNGFVN